MAWADLLKMMRIVVDSGYRGYVGIEFGGNKHSKHDGVRLPQALLQRVRQQLSAA